jgi:hypothetical protein
MRAAPAPPSADREENPPDMIHAHPDPSCSLTPAETPAGRIAPLVRRHGGNPGDLREELRALRSVGIRQCIIGSPPHPDRPGPGWWESLDVILDEAEALGMQIWITDGTSFTRGRDGCLTRGSHPEPLTIHLACRPIEARGPLASAVFRVGGRVAEGEALVGVVAARMREARGGAMEADSLLDLSDRVEDGLLRWDVPQGDWRLFLLVCTREGGEKLARDRVNPREPAAGPVFVSMVHEACWARYAARFGTTIAGFFTDGPRSGNAPAEEAARGKADMAIPWSDDLLAELDAAWGGPFRAALPALWHEAEGLSHRARFRYMDTVSGRFARVFSGAIGDWCRAHGVRSIGCVTDENGAHVRMGCGAAHFFRAQQGRDMSAMDITYSFWPGGVPGATAPCGPRDTDLFRWGIGKMASSAAHLDPRMAGNTLCECFGVNGRQPGLRGMKWITDHACVRGINFLVPHAFPLRFSDPERPLPFHAHSLNPQWRLFSHWADYAERLCHLLSGGEHCAPVAVLYNVEAEWSGDAEPFAEPVRALAEAQIDCDVVCMDTLLDPLLTRIGAGLFTVNRESFHCMVVPRSERLPLRMLGFLTRLQRAGVRVLFTEEAPTGASDGEPAPGALTLLRTHPMAQVVPREGLAEALRTRGLPGLRAAPAQPHLRTYRYRRRGMDLVFCWNEDPRANVDTRLFVDEARSPVGYDALADSVIPLPGEREDGQAVVRLRLEPHQSLCVAFPDDGSALASRGEALPFIGDLASAAAIDGPWRIAVTESPAATDLTPRPDLTRAGDLSRAPGLGSFSGTASYEAECVLPGAGDGLWLDLGAVGELSEAWIDGRRLGTRICPPHRYALGGVGPGPHALRVEVTTAPARGRGGDVSDRALAQEPAGLVGPVRLLRKG